MKRTPFRRRSKLSSEANELVQLADMLADAINGGSQLERRFWQKAISERIATMLARGDDAVLKDVLDRLSHTPNSAYEALADLIEAQIESVTLATEAGQREALFFMVPIFAWSRATIPVRNIPKKTLAALQAQLATHVFAPQAQLVLADHLLSPDHLSDGYAEIVRLANSLFDHVQANTHLHLDASLLNETAPFISDIRLVIGAVAVPAGAAVWRWQENLGAPQKARDLALALWQEGATPVVGQIMPACAIELGLPMAFFSGSRNAERYVRAFSLQASIAFIQLQFNVAVSHITAVLGLYEDDELEEWRIGFSLDGGLHIAHGVVWPVMDDVDDDATGSLTTTHSSSRADHQDDPAENSPPPLLDAPSRITQLLQAAGLTGKNQIVRHAQRFPIEFCDDCGAPYYPNKAGESVHIESPEDHAEPTVFH